MVNLISFSLFSVSIFYPANINKMGKSIINKIKVLLSKKFENNFTYIIIYEFSPSSKYSIFQTNSLINSIV
jgi:hypothetical protein